MMNAYPRVLGEAETVSLLAQRGLSISRYGDGEFKMMEGNGYRRETAKPDLTMALNWAFRANVPQCLKAIPTMDVCGPKYQHWLRSERRFCRHLDPNTQYVSAFISRPDSAPWINTIEFAKAYQKLWLGRRVAVLCEKDGSAYRAVRIGSKQVTHVRCPTHEAFQHIDDFEATILDTGADVAILSCGATASILAVRLAQRGMQAIDFGSGGSFIAKLLDQ